MKVAIREEECIGCTKCIQACPFDAILGAHKQMHTVIADECIGCELCIAPCPVDCIDMIDTPALDATLRHQIAAHAKKRYQARSKRLGIVVEQPKYRDMEKKAYIEAAISRVKLKKIQK